MQKLWKKKKTENEKVLEQKKKGKTAQLGRDRSPTGQQPSSRPATLFLFLFFYQ
jgi:hypothetical protein